MFSSVKAGEMCLVLFYDKAHELSLLSSLAVGEAGNLARPELMRRRKFGSIPGPKSTSSTHTSGRASVQHSVLSYFTTRRSKFSEALFDIKSVLCFSVRQMEQGVAMLKESRRCFLR